MFLLLGIALYSTITFAITYGEYFISLLKPNEPKAGYETIHDMIKDIHRIRMKSAEEDETELCNETTCAEMCRKLPKKTSPGPDGISYEVFMYGTTHLIQSVCRMFNIIWRAEEVLEQWKRSNIKTIYKGKGSKEDLSNYRVIFLSSVVCKLFEKIIHKTIEPILERHLPEFQGGARKGRRTTDNIITLKSKIEYNQYFNSETFIQFYDIVKCFDKLWLQGVMYDLANSGIKGSL